jgi:hypothetical protein
VAIATCPRLALAAIVVVRCSKNLNKNYKYI